MSRNVPRSLLGLVITVAGCLLAGSLVAGCLSLPSFHSSDQGAGDAIRLQAVNLNDITAPAPFDGPVQLSAAKNEWTSFTIELGPLPQVDSRHTFGLRLSNFNIPAGDAQITASNCAAYQILAMPVDVNRAGYVRHTGLSASDQSLPRALLPMAANSGIINLSSLRDSSRPHQSRRKTRQEADNPRCFGSMCTSPPRPRREITT